MKSKAKKKASQAKSSRASKNNYMAQPAGSRGSSSSRRSKGREHESSSQARM